MSQRTNTLGSGMVLFYNTFVAMKRQDSRPVPHSALLDNHGLIAGNYGEIELFGGRVLSDSLQHAIRVFKDRGSGVVRIEACARRGPMKDVPIWTAFVTHYKDDPDHVMLETRRVVSFAALRPKPYIFLHRYELPRNERGDYVLEFTTSDGHCRSGYLGQAVGTFEHVDICDTPLAFATVSSSNDPYQRCCRAQSSVRSPSFIHQPWSPSSLSSTSALSSSSFGSLAGNHPNFAKSTVRSPNPLRPTSTPSNASAASCRAAPPTPLNIVRLGQ
nr:hypothetical protein CFP56_16489 [Quercus suber]